MGTLAARQRFTAAGSPAITSYFSFVNVPSIAA
jgi:hypothetical protein